MFDSWNQSGRRATAAQALAVLIAAAGCFAAVAYAASAPPAADGVATRARAVEATRPGVPGLSARAAIPRPPRPRISGHPARSTLSTRVGFRYASRLPAARFQCQLDGSAWKRCGTRVAYRGLAVGPHRFLVRVEDRDGGRSLPSRFSWVQMEPQRFTIEPDLSGLSRLYPGSAPVALPLVLSNPNSAPILVTGLRVAVSADPAGCPSAANLELIQAGPSKTAPLRIPANGSVRLPAAGVSAPAIALRELPVNQDACQEAQFPLAFSGEARG